MDYEEFIEKYVGDVERFHEFGLDKDRTRIVLTPNQPEEDGLWRLDMYLQGRSEVGGTRRYEMSIEGDYLELELFEEVYPELVERLEKNYPNAVKHFLHFEDMEDL